MSKLKRMRDFEMIEKYIPDWRTINDYIAPYTIRAIPEISIGSICAYCEECDTEMYWPILEVEDSTYATDDVKKIIQEIKTKNKQIIDNVTDMEICPFCGAELEHIYGGPNNYKLYSAWSKP